MIALLVLTVALAATGYSHWHLRSQLNEAENGFHAALLAEQKLLLDALQKSLEYDADTRRALTEEMAVLQAVQDADRTNGASRVASVEKTATAELERINHEQEMQQRSVTAFEVALLEFRKREEELEGMARAAQNLAANAQYRLTIAKL